MGTSVHPLKAQSKSYNLSMEFSSDRIVIRRRGLSRQISLRIQKWGLSKKPRGLDPITFSHHSSMQYMANGGSTTQPSTWNSSLLSQAPVLPPEIHEKLTSFLVLHFLEESPIFWPFQAIWFRVAAAHIQAPCSSILQALLPSQHFELVNWVEPCWSTVTLGSRLQRMVPKNQQGFGVVLHGLWQTCDVGKLSHEVKLLRDKKKHIYIKEKRRDTSEYLHCPNSSCAVAFPHHWKKTCCYPIRMDWNLFSNVFKSSVRHKAVLPHKEIEKIWFSTRDGSGTSRAKVRKIEGFVQRLCILESRIIPDPGHCPNHLLEAWSLKIIYWNFKPIQNHSFLLIGIWHVPSDFRERTLHRTNLLSNCNFCFMSAASCSLYPVKVHAIAANIQIWVRQTKIKQVLCLTNHHGPYESHLGRNTRR